MRLPLRCLRSLGALALACVLHAHGSAQLGRSADQADPCMSSPSAKQPSPSAACTAQRMHSPAALQPIYRIQGSAATSPYAGQTVTTSGVITQTTSRGFFIQDPQGDHNPLTSDGLFVYTATARRGLAVGDRVQVTGRVNEFNCGAPDNPRTRGRTVTELNAVSRIQKQSSGQTITPTTLVWPARHPDELERLEGMLVSITTPMVVSQNAWLGRFGQLTLSAQTRLFKPTQLHRPGTPAALALAQDNAKRRLLLDDGSHRQNPQPTPHLGADHTVRVGDRITGLTGVLGYGLASADPRGPADDTLQPTAPVRFKRSNARSSAPVRVPGTIRLASFNVLNYFTTLNQSGAACAPSQTRSDCRGANHAEEFQRQRRKIVAALAAMDADVVGLMEMQNNGNTAVHDLVAALNAQLGPGRYASVALPVGGTGDDAIRVAMIFQPKQLTPLGPPMSDTDPVHSRAPLAQTFQAADGEVFSVVINHFKSKNCQGARGADRDSGDGQGCYNARRIRQAQALQAFVAEIRRRSGDPDVAAVGDFNAYAQEDPMVALRAQGWIDALATFNGAANYSYVHDGESGALDHAWLTPSLAAQTQAAQAWHINADEPTLLDYNTEFKPGACVGCAGDLDAATPYRSSDHDPLIITLNLSKQPARPSPAQGRHR